MITTSLSSIEKESNENSEKIKQDILKLQNNIDTIIGFENQDHLVILKKYESELNELKEKFISNSNNMAENKQEIENLITRLMSEKEIEINEKIQKNSEIFTSLKTEIYETITHLKEEYHEEIRRSYETVNTSIKTLQVDITKVNEHININERKEAEYIYKEFETYKNTINKEIRTQSDLFHLDIKYLIDQIDIRRQEKEEMKRDFERKIEEIRREYREVKMRTEKPLALEVKVTKKEIDEAGLFDKYEQTETNINDDNIPEHTNIVTENDKVESQTIPVFHINTQNRSKNVTEKSDKSHLYNQEERIIKTVTNEPTRESHLYEQDKIQQRNTIIPAYTPGEVKTITEQSYITPMYGQNEIKTITEPTVVSPIYKQGERKVETITEPTNISSMYTKGEEKTYSKSLLSTRKLTDIIR